MQINYTEQCKKALVPNLKFYKVAIMFTQSQVIKLFKIIKKYVILSLMSLTNTSTF